jgi:hypothetical protein
MVFYRRSQIEDIVPLTEHVPLSSLNQPRDSSFEEFMVVVVTIR